MEKAIFSVDLPLPLFKRGKVRDIYEIDGHLLIVATDRLSAFDVVLPTPIPYKGKVLTALSLFWFNFLKDLIPNHIRSLPLPPELEPYEETLKGRYIVGVKAKPIPIECVVRGYLFGSAWKEYQESGLVCGIKLPPNLKLAEKLPSPIFTPATKAEEGHDVNITLKEMEDIIGKENSQFLVEKSIAIYEKASAYAEERGIIIADTKFEFGWYDEEIILIDEVLTPDSSRFWDKELYKPGENQPSFDKQFVRDYLESINWDKTPPAPPLPPEVVEGTSRRYIEAYRRLTGKDDLI
ncbi:phosphoribosylaminoimidazolesuccinocarboxamide synthase [bacterium]|nr:phosphoribosylaminoimidazolesuccinocarboxamide synthase [bacterium]